MRLGINNGQLFEWLQNYARKEKKQSRCQMICDALQTIFAGENEMFLRELIASHMGKEFRSRFVKIAERKENREEILKKYVDKAGREQLLEELADSDDRSIQIILRSIDNVTLIQALAGASGKVCCKFLQNLSERLLFFVDEDISQYNGSEGEIREAQKRIFEIAAGMGLVKA